MNFDPLQALIAAKSIQATYAGTGVNIVAKDTDTQVRVEEIQPGGFAVIFPGTASFRDWRTDAKIKKTDWRMDGPKAHRGFVEAYRSVIAEIIDRLSAAQSVIIAGHSLGGALATLCADTLSESSIEIEAVYTFGSPRVFNGAGSRAYNGRLADRTFRIVNAGDPVPKIPWVLGTYRHVDSLVYLTKAGGIENNFVFAAARELAANQETEDTAHALVSVSAHKIESYIKKLKQIIC